MLQIPALRFKSVVTRKLGHRTSITRYQLPRRSGCLRLENDDGDDIQYAGEERLTEEQRRAVAYFTEQPRWTPPAGSPSIVELLHEDRSR